VSNLSDFGWRDVFQERRAGVKRGLPVERWQFKLLDAIFLIPLLSCVGGKT
jgi:hypothetical protein